MRIGRVATPWALFCTGTVLAAAALARAATPSAADWFVAERPTPAAQEAVSLLADAARHGLDPRDYAAEALAQGLRRAGDGRLDEASRDRLARALDAALQRLLHDLHQGRVDPASLVLRYAPAHNDRFDPAAVLGKALQQGQLRQAVDDASPDLPQLRLLREALQRVRDLAGHAAWLQPLPPLPRNARGRPTPLEAGQAWSGSSRLAARLAAWGDLPAPPPSTEVYDEALVDAVRIFQRRHGLADDGIVGPATWAALQVRPEARARQIELTLERARWTPWRQWHRMVVVNVPEFVLRAYRVDDGRIEVAAAMKVIVGQAMDTRTPLFDAELRSIEFSPFWNVPPSIARAELVPRLRRNTAALQREGFEIVGADGAADVRDTPTALDAVLAGQARIRQRPGPHNALGDIKFVLPNLEHIFLHHTPATGLFARERRDFSHGCIRVEQPVELALFALDGTPDWDRTRIEASMRSGRSRTVDVADPARVLIVYATALVKEGRVHFYDDLYGHDRRLDAALRQASRLRPPIERGLMP